MKFSFEHQLPTEPERVVAALTNQSFWELLASEPLSARPELVEIRTTDESILTVVRFQLVDDLPKEAARFIDPSSVTWVQETLWRPADYTAELKFIPNQAKELLHAVARINLVANSNGTQRAISGDLRIRIPLVGSKIEPPLISHIASYVDDESRILEQFLTTAHP